MIRLLRDAIAIVTLATGCYANDSATPAPPPGIPSRQPVLVAPPPTPSAPARNSWSPRAPRPAAPGTATTGINGTSDAPKAADVATATPPARDLSEELRALVRDPSTCFAERTAGTGPSTLTLDVNATVTPSGMITRAGVSGAGLNAQESACLEALVMRARFRSPVEGAPRGVQASVELREQPKPAKAPGVARTSP